jgi:hypothetical protein
MDPSPLVTPPAHPLSIDDSECFVVPATFGVMAGHGRARDAATSGMMRPADIGTAKVMPVERIFVPLWRFEGSADGFHVRLDTIATGRGRRLPIPSGGFRHHDGQILVPARASFPIDPCDKIRIESSDMSRLADHAIPDEERVLPDIDREDAEHEARARFRRRGESRQAIYSNVEVRIRSGELVYYPLYVVRYVYAGEATSGAEHVYHAAVSARTGETASTHHPPMLASLASKVRKLFG